ncbi:hypothetical protein HX004_13765 [Myroides sp. 1354]|uniref:hypothetical protein n=1 Tax=unclassified Myroides TaxID=2642485 RepID=UPI0025751820|nr:MULTISPECIES: hypothetical protein [unclassified Myroides]MDM1044466.1 hypothetical protein [Myroides sp. R163-1]MDM1056833.1 hypothetical protein [Myroides sp. 1354]MDM1069896.1 hypothetical protein [Myroides sp. 1372]
MELVYSILCILGGSLYLAYLFRKKNEESNFWDKSMEIRGYIGGMIFLLMGIVMLYRFFFD